MRLDQLQRTPCEEKSGFLFNHACTTLAYNRCDVCGKAVCDAHMQWIDVAELQSQNLLKLDAPPPVTDHGAVCTTCAKRLAKNPQSSAHRYRRNDDPFWYSSAYYPGYGYYGPGYWGSAYMGSGYHHHSRQYDSNDFTDADSASLNSEADGNFEIDASGS